MKPYRRSIFSLCALIAAVNGATPAAATAKRAATSPALPDFTVAEMQACVATLKQDYAQLNDFFVGNSGEVSCATNDRPERLQSIAFRKIVATRSMAMDISATLISVKPRHRGASSVDSYMFYELPSGEIIIMPPAGTDASLPVPGDVQATRREGEKLRALLGMKQASEKAPTP